MIGKDVSFKSIFIDKALDTHQSSDAEQGTKKKNTLPDPEFAHQFHTGVGFREISLIARVQPYVKSIWLVAAIGMVLILAGIIRSRNHNILSQDSGNLISIQSNTLVSLSSRAARILHDTSLKQQLNALFYCWHFIS